MASASSVSSATGEREKEISMDDLNSSSNSHSLDPVAQETEANILPAVEQEPQGDLEQQVTEKGPTPGLTDPSSFPDGGLEAWLVVFGAFCCLFCSFGWINCIGVFQNYYQETLLKQYSPSTVSWIPSVETFLMFLGGPVCGKLYDNYGPRYLLLGGTFLHVFGLMMTSLSTEYYQFILSQGICSPLGASAVFYPAMSSVSTWFYRNRAFAFGAMASGSSLGGVIFPILVQQLIPKVGFPWAMRSAAFLILFMLILANLTVKSRLPPTPKPLRLMEFITPLYEPPFGLIVVASFFFFFGLYIPFNFIIIEATSVVGMSSNLASYLLAILNAASVFGRTIPGFIADRYGRFNTMIIITYFSSIIVLALWLPARANAPTILFAALYGFGSGAFVSLAPALVAQVSDIRTIGVRTGTLFAIISTASLAGSPIGGALIVDEKGGYTTLQVFTGVMMLAGSTFFIASRWTLVKWKVLTIV